MKSFEKAKFSLNALIEAYFACRKNKTSTKQAMEFELDREKNLFKLYQDIIEGKYKIGRSICFIVKEPKPREVWAGNFRDRIVHHLIYNAIEKRYVSKFIYDTYSCIPGKGTLAGALRAEKFAKNLTQNYSVPAYFCKMDIKNYFVSINKQIMFDLVVKYIDKEEEKWLYNLIEQVIFHDPRKNVLIKSPKKLRALLPSYKSLFNADDLHGLPIGNLTSQFFSNIYLNEVDQFAKHVLKCKYYLRYVDDIIILDRSSGFLNYAYAEINKFLINNLGLELNHKKKNINLVSRGFDFVGHVIKPNRKHLRKRTIKKCCNAIEKWENNENRFKKEELQEFRNKINSYLGFLIHTDSYRFRKELSKRLVTLYTTIGLDYSKVNILPV